MSLKYNRKLTKRIVHSIAVAIIGCLTILVSCECGDNKPEAIQPPWIDTHLAETEDSVLEQMVAQQDTLAAMTLAWRKISEDSFIQAIEFLNQFNSAPETASDALNFITGFAYHMNKSYGEAISYLNRMENLYRYPTASQVLAKSYRLSENYDQAIELYKEMSKRKPYKEYNLDDSILRCRADQGDTLAGIQIGKKLMDAGRNLEASSYYLRYVPLARNKVPPTWYYMAGKSYVRGNNFTRASVYLENADAETTFAELKFLAGVAYYEIEAFDSAYSKFNQALKLGDSSYSTLYYNVHLNRGLERVDSALYYSLVGLEVHPDEEYFYFLPAQIYYENKDYEKLKQLSAYGVEHATRSFKVYTYYTVVNYLTGDTATADSLFIEFMEKFKMYPNAFIEAAKMYRGPVKMEDKAKLLEQEDILNKHPAIANILRIYHITRDRDPERAREILDTLLVKDTSSITRPLIEEFYRQEYPSQT
ncbi:MAG: hypothetical protein GF404_06400 [candidate division Zixibacteria bacterium]|nr:hypothetical protein [candidate division Zixibacteria bacterium]